jgi:hypothetical protein
VVTGTHQHGMRTFTYK